MARARQTIASFGWRDRLRFLVDAQLPPALARRLTREDDFAEHVQNVGLGTATDTDIRTYAVAAGAVLVTKDEDFAHRARHARSKVQVVWIRIGNVTNRVLWSTLQPRLAEIMGALGRGERLVEVR